MPVPKKQNFWIVQSIKHYAFDSEYEIGKEIGRGTTSVVYKCERKGLGHAWAVKILQKNKDKRVCLADAGLLLKLEHKNLVRLKEIFETRSKIFLVQELVTGGELFDRVVNMGEYSELVAAKAVRDLISGLDYLHNWGYVVRNLKPENLLYENLSEDSSLKISRMINLVSKFLEKQAPSDLTITADFALSSVVSPEVDISSVCGSPGYTAPEILKGERLGKAGDMWTVGVIVYILLCGYEPFQNDNASNLFKQILKGQYEFHPPHWDSISFNARDLVRKLLVVDPKKRLPSAAAIKNCWVSTSAAKRTVMEDVVERIKSFNEKRREKRDMLPLAETPGGSRMCSRATPYPGEINCDVSQTPLPDIQVSIPENSDDPMEPKGPVDSQAS